MADYQLTSGGVIRTADGAIIPDDDGNGDWVAYQAWVTGGGTPDAIAVPALADYRSAAKLTVNEQAEAEIAGQVNLPRAVLSLYLKKVQEAIEIEGDGSPSATSYPMLQAMVDSAAEASLADAGTTIRAEWAAVRATLGDIEEVRRKAFEDIDAAANNAAIDAVVAGITWP